MDPDRYSELTVDPREKHGLLIVAFAKSDLRSPLEQAKLGEEFETLSAETGFPRVILDFAGVRFMPSSVLGMVVKAVGEWKEAGVQCRVCGLEGDPAKAFDIMGAGRHVDIFPTRRAAAAADWDEKPRRWWWPFG